MEYHWQCCDRFVVHYKSRPMKLGIDNAKRIDSDCHVDSAARVERLPLNGSARRLPVSVFSMHFEAIPAFSLRHHAWRNHPSFRL